jgi:predicted dithiol-disulfide oxidoreductase (DUF899 family)
MGPDDPTDASAPAPDTATASVPDIVPHDEWRVRRDELLVREKMHTREGDAISAARRRLPMTEVDGGIELTGPDGPTTLLDLFEGRDQLIVYKHMWHPGEPHTRQCMGCTASIWDVKDAVYLHHRGVSLAVVCEGPWEEVAPYVEHMGYELPWFSAHGVTDPLFAEGYGMLLALLRRGERVFLTLDVDGRGVEAATMTFFHLLDLTAYGRQEEWEVSPAGWPQQPSYSTWVKEGIPVPQWSRPGFTPPA